MAKIASKPYLNQMAKMQLNCPSWLEKNLKYTHLKWLKITYLMKKDKDKGN